MKTKRLRSGFTLVELLVAMVITVILLGVLVYMTGISMDTYKVTKNEVRSSRQAKEAISILAKDLESIVVRRGNDNDYEWIYAELSSEGDLGPVGKNKDILNTSQLIFFTSATDRYDGDIGGSNDKGGDVSAVSYRLAFKDQISGDVNFATYSMYRHLLDPDVTFKKILNSQSLKSKSEFRKENDLKSDSYLVENIYEFTLTFLVEYTVNKVTKIDRITLSPSEYSGFSLKGNRIEVRGGSIPSELKNGSLIGVEVSITVLTDQGVTLAKKSAIKMKDLLNKYSYHYTKVINIPHS